jgi:flagellar hook-associated protein 2
MPRISAEGVASGLNVDSIVKQLVAIEREPIEAAKRRQIVVATKLSAFSEMRVSLSNLKAAIKPLQALRFFQAKSASSSDSLAVNVATTDPSSAVIGSSTVNQVITLANAQKLHSGAFTSSTASVGTGTLKIQVGNGPEIDVVIAAPSASLTDIRDKINGSGAGIIASVIKSRDQVYKLVLQSSSAGTQNTIQVNVVDDDGNPLDTQGLSQLRYTPKMMAPDDVQHLIEVQAAKDAVFVLDGETITRASNTITDVISGLTFTLLKKTEVDADISINVLANTHAVQGSIESFVKAYNETILGLRAAQTFDPDARQKGPLLGNITVQTIYNRLRLLPNRNVPDLEGEFKGLSDLGITTRKDDPLLSDGTLTVNASVLTTALQKDPLAVGRVFIALDKTTDPNVKISTSGVADQLGKALSDMLDGQSSRIASAEKGLSIANSTIEKEVVRLEESVRNFEKTTRKRFAKLEAALSRIQGAGAAFDRQIQQLEGVTSFIQQRNRNSVSGR